MMQTKQKLREEYMNWTCIEKEYESTESEQADWWLTQRESELKELVEEIHKILKETQSLPKYRFNKSGGDRTPHIWLEIDKIFTNKLNEK